MAALSNPSITTKVIQSAIADHILERCERDEPTPQYLQDELSLRYRITLEAARSGTTWLNADAGVGELLFMCAWFAHKGCGAFARGLTVRLEADLREARERGKKTGVFFFEDDAFVEFAKVMEMYEFQLANSTLGLLEEGVRMMEFYRRAGSRKPRVSSSRHGGRPRHLS